jgi:hypothetical protein
MTTTTARDHRADVLDDALDRLGGYGFVDGPGMAVHGPMGAEALACLGHDDDVASWVEAYKVRHDPIPAPPAGERLDLDRDAASWRPALGDPARLGDWRDGFRRLLAEAPWTDVLRAWLPRLFPGYGGAFTHGLIRTAHAVRLVELRPEPSATALDELATALAYWAGTYRALPGDPELRGSLPLADALATLPRPTQPWTPVEAGMFSRLDELDGLADAVARLAPPPSVDEGLSELTVTFARLAARRPDVVPMGLVHAVTPVANTRTLLPYLDESHHRLVQGWLWRVDAAITAGFVPGPVARTDTNAPSPRPDDPASASPPDDPTSTSASPPDDPATTPTELVALAADHRDPHVVKFTAACLAEHALSPDPAYLQAARRLLDTIPAW